MAFLVGAALAVFSVAIVLYPFLKSRLRTRPEKREDGEGAAPPELEPIYDAIGTLQLEFELGKVPGHLYREQLRGYRVQAAAILRQRLADRSGTPGWLLEQEVLLARAALRGVNGSPRLCANCRALPGPNMVVCAECGAELDGPRQAHQLR